MPGTPPGAAWVGGFCRERGGVGDARAARECARQHQDQGEGHGRGGRDRAADARPSCAAPRAARPAPRRRSTSRAQPRRGADVGRAAQRVQGDALALDDARRAAATRPRAPRPRRGGRPAACRRRGARDRRAASSLSPLVGSGSMSSSLNDPARRRFSAARGSSSQCLRDLEPGPREPAGDGVLVDAERLPGLGVAQPEHVHGDEHLPHRLGQRRDRLEHQVGLGRLLGLDVGPRRRRLDVVELRARPAGGATPCAAR